MLLPCLFCSRSTVWEVTGNKSMAPFPGFPDGPLRNTTSSNYSLERLGWPGVWNTMGLALPPSTSCMMTRFLENKMPWICCQMRDSRCLVKQCYYMFGEYFSSIHLDTHDLYSRLGPSNSKQNGYNSINVNDLGSKKDPWDWGWRWSPSSTARWEHSYA